MKAVLFSMGEDFGRVRSKYSTDALSSRLAMVVPQHSAEAFPAVDLSILSTDSISRIDDSVPQSLVISLRMIVDVFLRRGAGSMPFALRMFPTVVSVMW